MPSKPATKNSVEKPTKKPVGKPVGKSVENPAANPAVKPVGRAVTKPAQKPAKKTATKVETKGNKKMEKQELKSSKHKKVGKKTGRKDDAKKAGKKLKQTPFALQLRHEGVAETISSQVAYEGPLFKVLKEEVREPNGHISHRDIIRHNGSVVILAVDNRAVDNRHGRGKKHKPDPLVIMERQYRHAAGQYLWELPAGKIEPGEERLVGAKRELAEETGYSAASWTELVRYFASPGFLGEWMQVYLAEDLSTGTATPEADETLEIYPLPLSQVEALIADGQILDGKTLIGIAQYRQLLATRKHGSKKKKKSNSKTA
jgi:ADP-ribose pyrophosphatase